jgi:hypothetical protein
MRFDSRSQHSYNETAFGHLEHTPIPNNHTLYIAQDVVVGSDNFFVKRRLFTAKPSRDSR